MSSRRNFLDADNNIMERNLRFVKNDLEEDFNNYFGGSSSRNNNSNNVLIPPREYKVVQPKPEGGSHTRAHSSGMEKRRGFLLQLGLVRHDAYELAMNSDFDVNRLKQKCDDYFARGFRQDEVISRILSEINNQNTTRQNSPPPTISTFHKEKHDYRDSDRREYIESEHRSRNRSQQHEPSGRYQPSTSLSPNRGFSTLREREREEYFSQDVNNVRRETNYKPQHSRSGSPLARGNRREEYNQRSASRSPNRWVNERLHSPRNYYREERCRSSISRSPNRWYSSIQEKEDNELNFQHRNSGEEVRRASFRNRSRSFSPPELGRRQQSYRSSRSPSPFRDFREKNAQEFYNCRSKLYDSVNSRHNSPHNRSDSRKDIYQSRKSPISNAMAFEPSCQNFKLDNAPEYQRHENHSIHNRNIPSLLTLDLSPPTSEVILPQQNIPSLMSLQVFSKKNNSERPTASMKFKHQESNQKLNFYNKKNQGKYMTKEKPENENIDNQQHIEKVPIIQAGLKKPAPGHLKYNPPEYWSKWWPRYKYIENSIPKINPNDYEVRSCLFYLVKPTTYESQKRSYVFLNEAVGAIMKTVDINEANYYDRDIFKLFQYKKHLEDPNFQNNLTAEELTFIAPALRQFKIKPTMAFLHQSLIVRWHISLDVMRKVQSGEPIMSFYAKHLLNDKSFHYLVMESIQELKEMCQKDWPQFNEFYKNLKGKKVDIYSLGVGPK